MSRQDKRLLRFLSRPNDFTFSELISLLRGFGYTKVKVGKTRGSRVAFLNEKTQHIIRLHKPHPQKTLKTYQIIDLEKELKAKGFIR
jgi:hypothetical protein